MGFMIALVLLSMTACLNEKDNSAQSNMNNQAGTVIEQQPNLHMDEGVLIQKDENSERWLITEYNEDGTVTATWFKISEDTTLETGDGDILTKSDLKVGQKVEAWSIGEIAESYPEQAQAARLVLLDNQSDQEAMDIAEVIHTAINEKTPELVWAIHSLELNEETQIWNVRLVDGVDPEAIIEVRIDANTGEVIQDVVTENDAFRLYTPLPDSVVGSSFTVEGEARVFEASFSWTLEDGHTILAEGHETTDQGAPEWGHFEFEVSYESASNPVLTLILYVESAKDGSPEHQLMIPLKPQEDLIQYLTE